MSFVVVSLPAMSRRKQKPRISPCERSASPSSARRGARSRGRRPGASRRSREQPFEVARRAAIAPSIPAGVMLRVAGLAVRASRRTSPGARPGRTVGTPSISLITAMGSSAANSPITSTDPVCGTRRRARPTVARIGPSRSATRFGVNARLTRPRRRVWRGGSVSINIGSTASARRSSVMPPEDEKVVGVVERDPHVVVARERPEAVLGVEVGRGVVAQAPVEGVGVLVDLVRERIEADGLHGGHGSGVTASRGGRTMAA